MFSVPNNWVPYIVFSALTISAVGVLVWSRKRKNYERVGFISKLYFYPVKSLKAVEVAKGQCTKYGFEVNGVFDRSFMLVNEEGVLISQREAPSLVLLTPQISGNYLIINGPNADSVKVEIKDRPSPDDKLINCRVHKDTVGATDCGETAAAWFQSYLNRKDVRLVRFFSSQTTRKTTYKEPFFVKLRAKHPVGFQDETAFHLMSQASIDDLNSRLGDQKVSVFNFRPNILVEGCDPYAEDSWTYMKINEAEIFNAFLATRCLMTTNDPEKGILSNKEPLITLRKYRILEDPELLKIFGSIPCLGTECVLVSPGEIAIGNEIFAVVKPKPKMKEKSV